MKDAGYSVSEVETVMTPSNTIEVTEPDHAKNLLRLLDTLENHDDVQKVYANFDIDENDIE